MNLVVVLLLSSVLVPPASVTPGRLASPTPARRQVQHPPSQRELNGFILGQYKFTLTNYFKSKPYQILKSDEDFEQRVHILTRQPFAYMAFAFAPSAPDTMYSVQISGPAGTSMRPFLGLKLGATKEEVEAVLGPSEHTYEMEDVPGIHQDYEDRNYLTEFDAHGRLNSIRIHGYQGFEHDQTKADLPKLLPFQLALFRKDVDRTLDLLTPDFEIYFGPKRIVRFKLPARRELSDSTSEVYRALFASSKSVQAALRQDESLDPEPAIRVRDNGVIDYVYKFPKGKAMNEVVFKWSAGKYRVWEISLKK